MLVFQSFGLLRKLVLALTLVYMQNYPVFTIFAIIYQSQIMMLVIGLVWPFSSTIANKLELMNESFILLISYHLFPFTTFVIDTDTRD